MTDVEVHLSKLTQAVQRAYPLLEGQDIAEAVWLAQFMDFVSEEPKFEIPKTEQKNEPETPKPLENPLPEQSSEPDKPESPTATDVTSEPDNIPLYAESSKAEGTNQGGQPIRVPGVRMLQDRLLLERALRPLRRQVLSRQYFELDESATIDASAEQNIITPVLKGKAERWLDAHIVIDCGLSMIVWRETLHELTLLFKNCGIYANVQVWYLFTDEEKAYLTASNQTEARHCNPAELLNPRKQQLVLMCTDCASSAWFSGSVTKDFLSFWQDKMPVALIQMLPQRLWLGTALRNSELLNLTSSNPAALNKCLVNDDSWFDEGEQAELMQLPVIAIDPISLDALAKVLTGSKGQWVSGVLVEQGAFPVELTKELEQLSAEQRWQHFRQQASPLARKLAEYFSCIPLTLPVMRMVQHMMLPESNQTHLAEFVLGGLVRRVNDNFIEYVFFDGVDILLKDYLRESNKCKILIELDQYLKVNFNVTRDFFVFSDKSIPGDNVKIGSDALFEVKAKVEPINDLYRMARKEFTVNMRLSEKQISNLVSRFEKELGKADRQRIAQLLPLLQGETLNYATALNALFPGDDQQKSQNDFRAFRNRINSAAQEAGVAFKLEADSNKRSLPQQRECWFEGEDSKVADIERYSAEEASDGDSANIVPARGKPLDGKRTIKLFVSYARKDNKDKPQVDKFLEELKQHFSASKKYRYELWADWDVLLGADWDDEIKAQVDECDFGLMLVSLPFIYSDYISQHELPKLLERALPVGFQHFEWKNYEMKGLGEKQIFRHKNACYDRCTGNKRKDFIAELFVRIEARIDQVLPRNPPQPPVDKGGNDKAEDVDYVERISQRMWVEAEKGFDRNHTHSKARATSIQNVQSLIDKGEAHSGGEGIIATEYLLEWLRGKDSPAFCALLGESGMGKTTTCKALTRELLERRKTDKSLPLPIYVDLREYTWDKRVDFTLNDILDHILKKSWKGGRLDVDIKPEDIIQQVQTNRALIIWDGLDEVIVHMSSKLANDFIRQLWSVIPPLKQDRTRHLDAGKMLISCRSHYFRNVQEQNAMFTSEHLDGIKGQDYQALILLPFGEEQIETYLSNSLRLDKDKLQGVLELIRSVHNLSEMVERPYILSLIAQHIPQIEQLSLRGETIQGVKLYQSMVDSWLSRDTGRHQFSPQHKKQLMEYLAAALWKSGQREWNVDDLDEWLDDFLYENPKLASAYLNLDRNVLKEDLRTTTFIVRAGDEQFRFAHISLQEFFLASYLHRALKNDVRADWKLEVMPSSATLDFFIQLFVGEHSKRPSCERNLVIWLAEHDSYSSKLIFHAWLLLMKLNEVVPYQSMDMSYEDFSGVEMSGMKEEFLVIREAKFNSAKLDKANIKYIEFQRCDFSGASLPKNAFDFCRFNACQGINI